MSLDKMRAMIQYGDYYKDSKSNFIALLKEYKTQRKKVAIWGNGLKGKSFLNLVDKHAEYIHCVVDANKKFYGTKTKLGHDIVSPDRCLSENIDIIIVMNEVFYVEIYLILKKMQFTGIILDADRIVQQNIKFELIISEQDNIEWDDMGNTLFGYTMEDIQQKVFLILKEVDRICKKHKISYFLEAGSALGVQRYGGFIPCDDDIDIAMLREDYERFLKIAPLELDAGFLIQTMKYGQQYPFPYAQVVMDHTCFVRRQFKNINMHHGIHIDVAPLDNVPKEAAARRIQLEKVRYYTKVIRKKYVPELYSGKNPLKKFIVNYEYYLLKLVPIALLIYKLDKAMKYYNKHETGLVGDLCTHYKKEISFPKTMLFPTIEREFEDERFPTPNQLNSYLDVVYDDYKQKSPRENGMTKYSLEMVSLELNYKSKNIWQKLK